METVQACLNADRAVRLTAIKTIRDKIVGNKAKKQLYLELGAIPVLLQAFNESGDRNVQIQAASTIASFAFGPEESLKCVLRHDVLQALVQNLEAEDDIALSCARALRTIVRQSRENLISVDGFPAPNFAKLHALLARSPQLHLIGIELMCEYGCVWGRGGGGGACLGSLLRELARCDHAPLQIILLSSITTIIATGGGIVKSDFEDADIVEKVVDLMTSLLTNTTTTSTSSSTTTTTTTSANNSLAAYYAAKILTYLEVQKAIIISEETEKTILMVLCHNISNDSANIRAGAAMSISQLLLINPKLQMMAFEHDVVSQFLEFFTLDAKKLQNGEMEKLHEAGFEGLSALSSTFENIRKEIVQKGMLLHVSEGISSKNINVKMAALKCAKSLTRSVKTLRTHIADSSLWSAVLSLIDVDDNDGGDDNDDNNKRNMIDGIDVQATTTTTTTAATTTINEKRDGEVPESNKINEINRRKKKQTNMQIKTEATAVLCNILTGNSHMKSNIIAKDGISKLVRNSCCCNEIPLKIQSFWALKNLLYESDGKIGFSVFNEIAQHDIVAMINANGPEVNEQIFGVLRNVFYICSTENVQICLSRISSLEVFLSIANKQLQLNHQNLTIQVLYCICNILTHGAEIRNQVAVSEITKNIVKYLGESNATIVYVSLWCLINLLSFRDGGDVAERFSTLQSLGINSAIDSLLTHTSVEIRNRSRVLSELIRAL